MKGHFNNFASASPRPASWSRRLAQILFTAAAFSSMPRCAFSDSERPYEHVALGQVISVLRHGEEKDRYLAAIEMVRRAPGDAASVYALSETIRNKDESLDTRLAAANAVARIGAPAAASSDALVDVILDPLIDDGNARIAASAWGRLHVPIPNKIIGVLQTSRSPRIISTVSAALANSQDPAAAVPLIGALRDVSKSNDERFEPVVMALANLDSSASAAMVAALPSATGIQRLAIMRALSEMLDRSQAVVDGRIVDAALVRAAARGDIAQSYAVATLGNMKSADPRIVPALINVLQSKTDDYVKAAAAHALAKAAPSDARSAPAITAAMLQVSDERSDGFAEALHACGPLGLYALRAASTNTVESELRARIFRALGLFGSKADFIVDDLSSMINGNSLQLSTATDVLPMLGSRSLNAVPTLAKRLESDFEEDHRSSIAQAIAGTAPFASERLPKDLRVSRWKLYRSFVKARDTLSAIAAANLDPEEFTDNNLRPVEHAVRTLSTTLFAELAGYAAGALAIVLAGTVAWTLNWRLQRRIRVILGQRWFLVAGECDYGLEIEGEPARLKLRFVSEGSRSSLFSLNMPGDHWPPPEGDVRDVRNNLPPPCLVRLEVDERAFARPWALVIADPWSTTGGRIAGQLRLTRNVSAPARFDVRQVSFAGLRCDHDTVNQPLRSAAAEIDEVVAVARRWGAATFATAINASIEDFQHALNNADIVHAALHASPEGLFMTDGLVRADAISAGGDLRCRLLVLSACEAADISVPYAFLWAALDRGVNVIAAVRPVNDAVCRVFFSSLYAALLPRRNFAGVSISQAIRAGAAACEEYFDAAAARLGDPSMGTHWKDTVDSFVLFADPTLAWQLRSRRPVP